jgi:hypothetical protein
LNDSRETFNVEGYNVFKYEPQTLYSYFNEATCMEREFSYFLDDTEVIKFTVIIEFPEEMLIDDSYKSNFHKAYFFNERVEQLGPRKIKLEYTYENKVNFITAEEYKDFCKEREEITKTLPTIFYFPK